VAARRNASFATVGPRNRNRFKPMMRLRYEWIARQITEAFPWDEAPRYIIRDRDRIYGSLVTHRLRAMGFRDKPTAPASPWQNGVAERLIGPIRRECVQTLKNRILLENYFFPDDLEIQIGAFVANYNHLRYHEHQQSDPG
jgi:transposase InsO family protein